MAVRVISYCLFTAVNVQIVAFLDVPHEVLQIDTDVSAEHAASLSRIVLVMH
jgi:hypothetical protein